MQPTFVMTCVEHWSLLDSDLVDLKGIKSLLFFIFLHPLFPFLSYHLLRHVNHKFGNIVKIVLDTLLYLFMNLSSLWVRVLNVRSGRVFQPSFVIFFYFPRDPKAELHTVCIRDNSHVASTGLLILRVSTHHPCGPLGKKMSFLWRRVPRWS